MFCTATLWGTQFRNSLQYCQRMSPRGLFESLKRPEYTGANRCLPCTVLNAVLSVIGSAVLATLWLPLGVAALALCFALLYFRGYVVPGTPTITQRYAPDWVLERFGKSVDLARTADTTRRDTAGTESSADSREGHDIEAALLTAGVVEDCVADDDLCLTERFEAAWWRRIRRLRKDDTAARTQLAGVIDVDPDALGFDDGSRFGVTYEGEPIGTWDSEAAFYAELAVEPTLREWLDTWGALSDHERTQLITGMRAFLERCPRCEQPVEQVENVRKTCCSSAVVGVDIDCSACGARVFSGQY